jgi:hypothetical protein
MSQRKRYAKQFKEGARPVDLQAVKTIVLNSKVKTSPPTALFPIGGTNFSSTYAALGLTPLKVGCAWGSDWGARQGSFR